MKLFELQHEKKNNLHVHHEKTQISLGIRSDQSVHCSHEEYLDSWLRSECTVRTLVDQTRQGAQADLNFRFVNTHCVALSCHGSNYEFIDRKHHKHKYNEFHYV